MSTRCLPTRKFRRRRSRGAALVEAAVVIPVMLVFLGLILFTARSYGEKLDQQTVVRSKTLAYASHSCTGSSAGVNQEAVGAAEDDGTMGRAASKLGLPGLGGDRNVAIGRQRAVVSGSAANDRKVARFSRRVQSMSRVVCSPKTSDSRWQTMLELAGTIAQGGGKGIF